MSGFAAFLHWLDGNKTHIGVVITSILAAQLEATDVDEEKRDAILANTTALKAAAKKSPKAKAKTPPKGKS